MTESKSEFKEIKNKIIELLVDMGVNKEFHVDFIADTLLDKFHIIPKENMKDKVTVARFLLNTFHIIPRTDSPEKWVEVYDEHGVKYYYKVKLKWRKEAKG